MLDVAAGTAHHHLLQHLVTKFLIDGINAAGKELGTQGATLRHKALEFLNPRGKGIGNVGDTINRATGSVLEQQQLVLDVFGRVIEWRGRKQQHALVAFDIAFVQPCRLADALQQVVIACAVVTEIVRLINDDEVVVTRLAVVVGALNDLIQATVTDKLAIIVFDLEIAESVFPIALHRWREDDKNTGVVAVCGDKPLGNHGSHHGFAQTHHIGNETATMLHHDIITLHYCVTLVGEVVVIVGQMRNEIIFNLIAEMVDEHPHIKFVGCGLMFFWGQMGFANDMVHIVHCHWDGIFPKALKLFLAVMHIVVVLHGHVQFVAWRFGGAETLCAEVAATHDDPAVAMFIMVFRQTEIELCMKVFGGMDTQLQPIVGNVSAELPDAFIDF